MTASVKHLEKESCSLQCETRMLQKTNAELMRMSKEQNTAVGRSVGRPVKSVATQFLSMAMCIRNAIPKWCLCEVSETNYFIAQLRQN